MNRLMKTSLGTGLTVIAIFILFNLNFFVIQVKYFFQNQFGSPTADISYLKEESVVAEPNRLIIPMLGIDAPVLYGQRTDEAHFQELLQQGVVHFPGTVFAGQEGNVYIFGHSSDLPWVKGEYKTVFALLPKIQPDAIILLSNNEGRQFKYKVRSTKVVQPSDLSVLSQETSGKKILSVQTSYPVGTALKRFVVIAELVE